MIRDTLAPLLEKVASRDDVMPLLKQIILQRADIAGLRHEVREIDNINNEKAMGFHKSVLSKIDKLQKQLGTLIDKVAGLDDRIGRLDLQSEIDVAKLRTDRSDWADHAERPSLISREQCNPLKEEIVAAVEERSARQISLLRDDILIAVGSLKNSDTSADGPTTGSKKAPALR